MLERSAIITAVKNLNHFYKVSELRGAVPKRNGNGSLFIKSGGFNAVFLILHNSKKWALRVWVGSQGKNKLRFQITSQYLTKVKLSYFVAFFYDEESLLINGEPVDTIRMEWVEGVLLKKYIKTNLNDVPKLKKLAEVFLQMSKTLIENRISHGDLQEENIIINAKDQIKLIDYDSICTPNVVGEDQLITGKKGYQHPSRFLEKKASLKSDCFSQLIIYLSILAIAENADLWYKYKLELVEWLLFTDEDFLSYQNSEIYQDLNKLSPKIKFLSKILVSYLTKKDYKELEPFYTYVKQPRITEAFSVSCDEVLEGDIIKLKWEIENVSNLELLIDDKFVAQVTHLEYYEYKACKKNKEEKTHFKLIVYDLIGEKWDSLKAEVVFINKPTIHYFKSNKNKVLKRNSISFEWQVQDFSRIYLVGHKSTRREVTSSNEIEIYPDVNENFYLEIESLVSGRTIKSAAISIKVFQKLQLTSSKDKAFTVQTLPVKLQWETKNAESVIISSKQTGEYYGRLPLIGELEVYPNQNCTYRISAENELEDNHHYQKIEVFPIPKIGNIKLPEAIDLMQSSAMNNRLKLIDLDFGELLNSQDKEVTSIFQQLLQVPKRILRSSVFNIDFKELQSEIKKKDGK